MSSRTGSWTNRSGRRVYRPALAERGRRGNRRSRRSTSLHRRRRRRHSPSGSWLRGSALRYGRSGGHNRRSRRCRRLRGQHALRRGNRRGRSRWCRWGRRRRGLRRLRIFHEERSDTLTRLLEELIHIEIELQIEIELDRAVFRFGALSCRCSEPRSRPAHIALVRPLFDLAHHSIPIGLEGRHALPKVTEAKTRDRRARRRTEKLPHIAL